MMKQMIKMQKVTKTYPVLGEGDDLVVLNQISLDIHHGDSIAITGPSGSGKTTLLNLLGMMDEPTSGDILIDSRNTSNLSDDEKACVRNKDIGFVFQHHYLMPQLNVIENVLLPIIAQKKDTDLKDLEKAKNILDDLGLKERLNHFPDYLSGGEKMRVAIARALINDPKIILADEPTGSLDFNTAMEIMTVLTDLNRSKQTTLVLVTHNSKAASMMNQSYKLIQGELFN